MMFHSDTPRRIAVTRGLIYLELRGDEKVVLLGFQHAAIAVWPRIVGLKCAIGHRTDVEDGGRVYVCRHEGPVELLSLD